MTLHNSGFELRRIDKCGASGAAGGGVLSMPT